MTSKSIAVASGLNVLTPAQARKGYASLEVARTDWQAFPSYRSGTIYPRPEGPPSFWASLLSRLVNSGSIAHSFWSLALLIVS